jgi:hypothetical protein
VTASVATGVTYETTRGTFKVISGGAYYLILERADKRHVAVALSDWQTWQPVVVDHTSVGCDE